ncbi:glycosyltransferase family 4 protein [Seongchinamella unica]|uniref:Glycosyltransferase family 4 protein n=1 Tax=Seongchinamella unica TaxID=2547392 RepID=A0A4R5LRL3_9GAMM|nr:glycosyltransferase family 4 protein [Seongchinamella unica]
MAAAADPGKSAPGKWGTGVTVLLVTLLLSLALCGAYLRFARRLQILDRPNERSSHTRPTPHGGGVPLLLAMGLGVAMAPVAWQAQYLLLMALAFGLSALGVLDDLRGLSVRLRFSLYCLACVLAVLVIQNPLATPGPASLLIALVSVAALLWMLNLYNFMDGIDGYAATQCIIACACVVLLAWGQGAAPQYLLFCLLLAAAQVGFLFWNWPTARLFMGDAGSVPTGFLLGALALYGHAQGYLPLACWLILLAVFVTDASVTLLWRVATGQAFTQPHRLHAYQRLSRHLGGHLPVVLLLLALNGLWLFPLALASAVFPKYSILLVILAYVPLLAGMAKAREFG